MSRATTEELIARVWTNLRARRPDEDLPEKCPINLRMALEAADEIAKWRAMEEMAARKRTYRGSKKQ